MPNPGVPRRRSTDLHPSEVPIDERNPIHERSPVDDLLDRAATGDTRACEQLYHRAVGQLLGAVRAQLHPCLRKRVDSMDIVQSALREAWEHQEQLQDRTQAGFLAWASTIAVNKIRGQLEYHLAQRRDIQREKSEVPGPDRDLPGSFPPPSEVAAWQEEWRLLLHAVDGLPDFEKEVILLRRFEQCGWSELSERMGKPIRTLQDAELRARTLIARSMR